MHSPYFDAHLSDSADEPPPDLAGAIVYGPGARQVAQRHSWHFAEERRDLAAAPPSGDALVIDLQFECGELSDRWRLVPEDWRALCEACAGRRLIKLQVAPGPHAVAGVRRLVRAFRNTTFLLDGFRHGPDEGWQAHVRVAEFDNVFLTTVGMWPGAGCRWPQAAALAEVFHFTIGEIGAGKVLFASGGGMAGSGAVAPPAWLQTIPTLNDAERELIRLGNARWLLAALGR